MNFSEKLIQLRKQKGLSQEELGEKLDVTRQTISKWELGQTSPDMAKLTEIANLFEISIDDLTNEEELKQQEIKNQSESENNSKKEIKTVIVILVIIFVAFSFVGIFCLTKFLNFGKGIFNTGKGLQNKAEKVVTGVFNKIEEEIDDKKSGIDSIEDAVTEILNGSSNSSKEEIQKEIDELYESLIPLKTKFQEEFKANGFSEEYYRIQNEIRKIESKISDLELEDLGF